MVDLINRKIVPHEKMVALKQEEIKDYLSQLKEGWLVSPKPNGEGGEFLSITKDPSASLRASFKFEDFVKAMEFVNKIAVVAEKEDHHPDIAIHYNKVDIILWSHFINGLSENDFIIAAKIDNISLFLGNKKQRNSSVFC